MQTPSHQNSARCRGLTGIGESLTSDEAIEKLRRAEEESKKNEDERTARKQIKEERKKEAKRTASKCSKTTTKTRQKYTTA